MTAWIRWATALAIFAGAHASHAQTTIANVNPVTVDFGAVKMGATVSVPVTIQNISGETVGIANGGISGTNLFTTDAATCGQSNYQVAPGASCYFQFTFTPSDSSGVVSSTRVAILVQTRTVTQVAILNFSGSGTETLAQVSPVSIDFGSIFQNTEVIVPVKFVNAHSQPITFAGGGFSNDQSEFRGDSGTCPASLASGASCHFNYHFTASRVGVFQASTGVSVNATAPVPMSEFVPLAFKGTGNMPLDPFTLAWPVSFDFGLTKVGHANTVLVYYQNKSSGPISAAGGGFNDDQGGVFEAFSSGGPNCDQQLIPPGATCSTQYVFEPHAAKAYSAATGFDLSNSSGTNYYPLNMVGTGVGTLARVSPPTVDLGSVAFETSASVPVVITNTSDAPLINFTGGQTTYPFSSSSTCPSSLAVGSSCAYTYTFYAPAASNSLKATYTASTLLTFTNSSGIQPLVPITITAHVGDRIFGDGFGS